MASKWSKIISGATGNRVEYLVDGTAAFKSIADAINTANKDGHYIYVMGWMLDIDFPLVQSDSNTTLYKLLSDASGKGVEVRILVWDNPIPDYQKMILANIPKLNKLANVLAFVDDHTYSTKETKDFIARLVPDIMKQLNRFAQIFKELDLFYTILKYCMTKNVGSHHEKVVIVKGEKGLISHCGGIDINQNRFKSYHDTHCRVEGPAAHQILQKFKKRWNNHPDAKSHSLKGKNEPKPGEVTSGDFHYAKAVGTYNDPDSNDRDRSLKEAYLAIISNAEKYIYIEDQYLVNLDVANELNKRVKDPKFLSLIIVMQDSKETTDILIPDRKRGDFWNALTNGTSQQEQNKIAFLMIDEANAKKGNYHPGVHAKTLIVDDEIAIIGSANVNQRSFTQDSETSLIIFDDPSKVKSTFAKSFRISIWSEFVIARVAPHTYESWGIFSYYVINTDKFSILIKYINSIEDLDKRIIDKLKVQGVDVIAPIVAGYLLDKDITKVSAVLSPVTIPIIFDLLWDNVIDPVVK